MIAIATLAALGQAIQDALVLGGIAVLILVLGCATAVAVVVMSARAERRWERIEAAALPPQGPDDGEPLTEREKTVLDAMETRGEPGHKESGSL